MKWCRFEGPAGPAFGTIEGATVKELAKPPFDGCEFTGREFPLASITLLPPVLPPNFYAIGRNYVEHIDWANAHHGMSLKIPQQADIGYRSANALVGSGQDIVIPAGSRGSVEFEGELVAIVGRKAKHLTRANALDCICGYTLGNDLSERTFQRGDGTMWRSKNMDTFKPMGPYVETDLDPSQQTITVRVNGQVASSYHTSKAIFDLRHYLVTMTEFLTLHPGDVIWLGCDGPTLPALRHGDRVEVINDHIGVLSNTVVRESGTA